MLVIDDCCGARGLTVGRLNMARDGGDEKELVEFRWTQEKMCGLAQSLPVPGTGTGRAVLPVSICLELWNFKMACLCK